MKSCRGYLTPPELADIFKTSVQAVYKTLKSHQINTKTGKSRRKFIPPTEFRRLLEGKGFKFLKSNISFQIVKGGAGKTSLSYSLAIRASHYGVKILLIDLDMQGNLTRSFQLKKRDYPVWINFFRDEVSIKDAVLKVGENIDLIASNLNNSRLDMELSSSNVNLRDHIRDMLSPIRDSYDLVIIDCPPAINKISAAATCASDLVVIPLNPDPYAMDGLEFTLAELKNIKKHFKVKFDYKIVWNKYDARERLGTIYMHDLAKDEEKIKHMLPVVVRVDSSFKNSIADLKSIYDLPKKSNARVDIDQFCREIIGISTWTEKIMHEVELAEMV